MSRRSRSRRRRKRRRPNQFQIQRRGRLSVWLDSVELVRGHDGFLRGAPEPALLLAAVGLAPHGAILLHRVLRRLPVTRPFPSVVQLELPRLFTALVPMEQRRVALLGLALEEDRGTDVAALYAALADVGRWNVWSAGAALPEPLALGELLQAPLSAPPLGRSVRLLRDGVDLEDGCRADKWIGAAMVLLHTRSLVERTWRMHFLARDGRNDWTAHLRLGG